MGLYILTYYFLKWAEEKDCYASTHGDMTPLFENPPTDWMQIQYASPERLNSGDYVNVTDKI